MSTQSNRRPEETPDTNVKQMIYVPPEVDTAMRRYAFENGVTLSAAYVRAARAMVLGTAVTRDENAGLGPQASTPANSTDFVTRGEFEALVENLCKLSGKIDAMASGGQSSEKARSKASRAVEGNEPKVEVAKRLILDRLAEASGAVHGGELDRLVESHGFKKSLAATAKNELLRGGLARRDGSRWTLGTAPKDRPAEPKVPSRRRVTRAGS